MAHKPLKHLRAQEAAYDRHAKGGALTMGEGVALVNDVDIDTTADVTIGENTIICEGTKIFTHDHLLTDHSKIKYSPLSIGKGVFIGSDVRIISSVSAIGDGAAIGVGSVLTKDVPAGEFWAGNPARFKHRVGEGDG